MIEMTDSDFVIESGIPLPGPSGSRGESIYPFERMSVGDSVFIEGAKSSGKEYAAARVCGKRKGMRFTARTVEDGVRIWRVE